MCLFLKIKSNVKIGKTHFFRKQSCVHVRNCTGIFHAANVCYVVEKFDIVSLRFRKKDSAQYFSNAFSHINEALPKFASWHETT